MTVSSKLFRSEAKLEEGQCCPTGFESVEGNCVAFVDGATHFCGAKKECARRGGRLYSAPSHEDLEDLLPFIAFHLKSMGECEQFINEYAITCSIRILQGNTFLYVHFLHASICKFCVLYCLIWAKQNKKYLSWRNDTKKKKFYQKICVQFGAKLVKEIKKILIFNFCD